MLFRSCRALAQGPFTGHCESVRSFGEAKLYLERAIYPPRLLSRRAIIVVNWYPNCDAYVLEFVHWVRIQPQLRETALVVFVKAPLSFAAQERAQHEGVTELIVRSDTFEDLLPQLQALLERCANRSVER